MKAYDIVLPPATTAKEEWERWQNRMMVQFHSMSLVKKKIVVKNGDTDE